MPFYKLIKGSLGLIIDGSNVDVEKGQTVELTEEQASKYKHLRQVGKPTNLSVQFDSAAIVTAVVSRDWSTTQDMKGPEVISLVNEVTSVNELESLYDVEEKGHNRATVLRAIEKRVTQLEGGQ